MISEYWKYIPELPDVSRCLVDAGSRSLLCMGLFSIFWQRTPAAARSFTITRRYEAATSRQRRALSRCTRD
jgi:hypothetical protein